MSSDSDETGRSSEDSNNNVRLITSKKAYNVKISDFAFYSLKIRKLAEMDKVPAKINLSPYDDAAVKTLVGYIKGDDQSEVNISYYALADLLDLARSLFIINLLRQLENTLMSSASHTSNGLLQSLLIVGKERLISGGLTSRRKIEALAAASFCQVANHRDIGQIPPIIFANLIARCDLNVKSEMEVVDAGLVWIWKQKNHLAASQMVFSRIRTAFLTPGDKSTIRQRVKSLLDGEKVLPLVASLLASAHCRRCCMIKEHIDNKCIRCGVPNPSDDNKVNFDMLPLSQPGQLKMKREAMKAKKRNSSKSRKSSKSKGHSRSSSRRRHGSSKSGKSGKKHHKSHSSSKKGGKKKKKTKKGHHESSKSKKKNKHHSSHSSSKKRSSKRSSKKQKPKKQHNRENSNASSSLSGEQ